MRRARHRVPHDYASPQSHPGPYARGVTARGKPSHRATHRPGLPVASLTIDVGTRPFRGRVPGYSLARPGDCAPTASPVRACMGGFFAPLLRNIWSPPTPRASWPGGSRQWPRGHRSLFSCAYSEDNSRMPQAPSSTRATFLLPACRRAHACHLSAQLSAPLSA